VYLSAPEDAVKEALGGLRGQCNGFEMMFQLEQSPRPGLAKPRTLVEFAPLRVHMAPFVDYTCERLQKRVDTITDSCLLR
jgi:hypothetical protein